MAAFSSILFRDGVTFYSYNQDEKMSQINKTMLAMLFGAGTAPCDVFANHLVKSSMTDGSFKSALNSFGNVEIGRWKKVIGARALILGISVNVYYPLVKFLDKHLD